MRFSFKIAIILILAAVAAMMVFSAAEMQTLADEAMALKADDFTDTAGKFSSVDEQVDRFNMYLFISGGLLLAVMVAIVMVRGRGTRQKHSDENLFGTEVQESSIASEEHYDEEVAAFEQQFQNLIKQNTGEQGLQRTLTALCNELECGAGLIYSIQHEALETSATFAVEIDAETKPLVLGEGLAGQAAVDGQAIFVEEIPEGYAEITSGLGKVAPRALFIGACKNDNKNLGVLELAFIKDPSALDKLKLNASLTLIGGQLASLTIKTNATA